MSEHQLWNELGNIHINAGEYEQALGAYKKAVDLAPKSGQAYKNLATAYVRLSEPEKAIPHYQRGIELFEDFSDKAASWHRLGVAYQMLNDDKNTLLAFERAAALDPENPLYQDDLAVILSEISDEMLDIDIEDDVEEETVEAEESAAEMKVSQNVEEETNPPVEEKKGKGTFASWIENTMSVLDKDVDSAQEEDDEDDNEEEEVLLVEEPVEYLTEEVEETDETPSVPPAIVKELIPMLGEDNPELDASVDELFSEISQEMALASEIEDDDDGDGEEDDLVEAQEADEVTKHKWLALSEQDDDDEEDEGEDEIDDEDEFLFEEDEVLEDDLEEETEDEFAAEALETELVEEAPEEELAEEAPEEEFVMSEAPPVVETAPKNGNGNGNGHNEVMANATVWGEMGNIFFNADILDGAQIAYKKALELDGNYGAVMHNLALLHMHKGEFSQAVELYQQSIAHLEDDTEQVKTWNNLGNAYRAMRDYAQAEEAYRKADELDTKNITLENWTRHGLLGTQKA